MKTEEVDCCQTDDVATNDVVELWKGIHHVQENIDKMELRPGGSEEDQGGI
jgi:hypothetical protein